jgi:hypothetical protein
MNPLSMRANRQLIFLASGMLLFFSCKRTEEFQTDHLSDYTIPLQVGKYITYRLDSTVYTAFGTNAEIHSYQEKHVVDAQLPDGLGRPSYRIFRYLRDISDSTGPWKPAGTYWITVMNNTVELTENNLRFVKLALPFKKDFSWKGNHYLPSDPYSSLFTFTNDKLETLADWDYTYTETKGSMIINGKTFNNVLTDSIIDENTAPDTVQVVNNTASIRANVKNVYLRGNATDTVKAIVDTPSTNGFILSICNRANWPLILDSIVTPQDYARSYEWSNKKWTYSGGKDTLDPLLPFAYRNYAIDKYAKGVGLIYQEYIIWDFQPPHLNIPNGQQNGFGIRRSIIDHN